MTISFSTAQRILRYEVPVDDRDHWVDLPGPIMHVATRRADVVEIWASTIGTPTIRRFRVFGTGQEIPLSASYVATAIVPGGAFVWHLVELPS